VLHALGFEPDGQLELVRRDALVVEGAVEAGGRVRSSADGLDQAEMLGLPTLRDP
jgi:hypothetical protein